MRNFPEVRIGLFSQRDPADRKPAKIQFRKIRSSAAAEERQPPSAGDIKFFAASCKIPHKAAFYLQRSVLPAAAQEQASKFDASYIQVWGQAEKEITPDEFYLSVTINEKDSKGKISIQTQERAMLDALKKLGVDTQKQLRVVDMSSEYFKKGNALAWKQFQLKLNTPEQVVQVFGSLNDLGISNVSMEKVTHSQLDQYKNEVRIAAMKSAQANAQTLAGAIGQKAGKCFYI